MSNLDGARMHNADCTNLNAIGLSARGADFQGSIFIGARLDESNLNGAVLSSIRIDGNTSFKGTNLLGAKIDGAMYVNEDGSERPVKWSDLKDKGAVVAASDLVQERAVSEGRFMNTMGISAEDVRPKGPSTIDILIAGSQNAAEQKLAYSDASQASLGGISHNAPITDEMAAKNGGKGNNEPGIA